MFFLSNPDGTKTIVAIFDTEEAALEHEEFAKNRFDIISSVIEPDGTRWKLTQIRRKA